MRSLVQRVKSAHVSVQGQKVASIGQGLLLFAGIGRDDDDTDVEYMCNKIVNLRIFEDAQGKMNFNVSQINGQILSVSQFTLYGNIRKGNRPGFDESAEPLKAKDLWIAFNNRLRDKGADVKEGVFGAHMEVELINDGPVTIWIDSNL